jgi:hypothetical protein
VKPWYARGMQRVALFSVVMLGVLVSGCRFGEAHFSSTMPGRIYDPAGTVFTYVDEHDDNLSAEENPRTVIAMTWIVFDPNGDLNDLEGSALADYSHELKLRDALALVFDEQDDLGAGASFEHLIEGQAETVNGMRSVVHLAPERLSSTSTYGDFIPFASRRRTIVNIQSADFAAAAPVVTGEVTVAFERIDDVDPPAAHAGTFSGTFIAPLVNERAAEQNLALLDVEDVLGLPLPPKEAQP